MYEIYLQYGEIATAFEGIYYYTCLLKGWKTDCGVNYRGMSLLSYTYKIVYSILVSRLVPCGEKIIGDHWCRFQCNRLTTDQLFCIQQILEKKREYNEKVHQLSIDFEVACDSFGREVLYNILTEFDLTLKLVMLIKFFWTKHLVKFA
jgi:hypothetical protein